jgi:hypothetical protein
MIWNAFDSFTTEAIVYWDDQFLYYRSDCVTVCDLSFHRPSDFWAPTAPGSESLLVCGSYLEVPHFLGVFLSCVLMFVPTYHNLNLNLSPNLNLTSTFTLTLT